MKEYFYISIILITCLYHSISAEKSVAVLNIKSSKIEKSDLATITNYVTTELSRQTEYKVIAWDDIEKMLEHEAGKQMLGCDDDKCIAEIGGALGVDFILAGDIGNLGFTYLFNLKIIDINKAQAMARVSESVTGDMGLFIEKIPQMVEKLALDFVAEENSTVTDIEGNIYKTVKIGKQIWTMENLKVTKYNDGTPIPYVNNIEEWNNMKTGACCYYLNDKTNKDKYGVLYNWFAVNTQKLAPKGWRVPTKQDWINLENYLIKNGYNWDGSNDKNKLAKSLSSKNFWQTSIKQGAPGNNSEKNNSTNFSAIGSGCRWINGNFYNNGENGLSFFWSIEKNNNENCYFRSVRSDQELFGNGGGDCQTYGLSIRLIKE